MCGMEFVRIPYECPAREATVGQHRGQYLLAVFAGVTSAAGGVIALFSMWTVPADEGLDRWTFALLLVLAFSLIPLGLFLAAYIAVAPRRLRYRIEPGVLIIRTWLVTRRFEISGAPARRWSPGRAFRIAGTAVPGYFAGLFRADGANVRMYATAERDGIAIAAGRTVFVTPPDNTAFLAALRAAGARAEA
jgi:hypothetical protein